jgi:hypothetical protein
MALRLGPTPSKTNFPAPRNHLFCFFFFSLSLFCLFAAEIAALEVLAISFFFTLRRQKHFCVSSIYGTVVANIPLSSALARLPLDLSLSAPRFFFLH